MQELGRNRMQDKGFQMSSGTRGLGPANMLGHKGFHITAGRPLAASREKRKASKRNVLVQALFHTSLCLVR
jgi:hypothetical protein